MNNAFSMNTKPISPAELEQALAAKLRELLGQVEWLREARVERVSGPAAGFDLLAALPLADELSRPMYCTRLGSDRDAQILAG